MQALRRLREVSHALYNYVVDVVRVWVRDKFHRDAFLTSKYDEIKTEMLVNLNRIFVNTRDADSIQVLGMMPTASLHMVRTRHYEKDASVAFFLLNMSMEEHDECFSASRLGFWNAAGISGVFGFHAITSLDFQDRVDAFAESEWAQCLEYDVVEFIANEFAILERLSSPFVTAMWANAGRRPDWLHGGLNITRDSCFSLVDAMNIFWILSDQKAEEEHEPQNSE